MKGLSKRDKILKELSNITTKLEQIPLPNKEISNITKKLKKLMNADIADINLKQVIHLIISKKVFKEKFLKIGFRKLAQLLAEFGVYLNLKISQLPRQAESSETFGFQFPKMAVDPTGKWVIQAANISSRGNYRLEHYMLKDNNVIYHHMKEFYIKGDPPTSLSNHRVKGLAFNSDGSVIWVSVGTKPIRGPFRTWLVKIDTFDWSYEIFGIIFGYDYFNKIYSRAHFNNFRVINDNGKEKLITPIPSTRNLLGIFDPMQPLNMDTWEINIKPADLPNYYTCFTDFAIKENLIYIAGWAFNASSNGINNPCASLIVMNINDRSVQYGPYYIPEMLGYYDYTKDTIWPLKIRFNMKGDGVYLIAEKLAPLDKGGANPDHSGFALIDLQTNKRWITDNFPHNSEETIFQSIRDIIEFGNGRYMQILKRDIEYNIWQGLVLLDENLKPTNNKKAFPDDWWPQVFIEPHPIIPAEIIMSAVRPIYHPNNPTGLIAIWKAF